MTVIYHMTPLHMALGAASFLAFVLTAIYIWKKNR